MGTKTPVFVGGERVSVTRSPKNTGDGGSRGPQVQGSRVKGSRGGPVIYGPNTCDFSPAARPPLNDTPPYIYIYNMIIYDHI